MIRGCAVLLLLLATEAQSHRADSSVSLWLCGQQSVVQEEKVGPLTRDLESAGARSHRQ